MGKVSTTAVRSLERLVFYYEGFEIVASKPEIVVRFFGDKVTEIRINCFFLSPHAEELEYWDGYPKHFELRDEFDELRLWLRSDEFFHDTLMRAIKKEPNVHPVDLMLGLKSWKRKLIFTDLEIYRCDLIYDVISKRKRLKMPWPRWEWYIPDETVK